VGFEKENFAALLILAKGNRSINKYGNDAGVDPGYISRLARCLINKPPSAAVIVKLSDAAQNNVTLYQMMNAAGYIRNAETLNPDNQSLPCVDNEWDKVREEAHKYDIPPDVAVDLIRSLGESLKKLKK